MPSVHDILGRKGSQVFSTSGSTTVLQAVHLMNEHHLGAVVVKDGGSSFKGIFTERDLLVRVVAAGKDPARTLVSDVMTSEVICVPPEMDIDAVSGVMQQKRIRHLPVCDGDKCLLGMISIGDVNAMHANQQESTIQFLNDYVYGRA